MDWKEALQNLNQPDGADDEQPAAEQPTAEPANEGALLVELDCKGRRGKEATIISGFAIDDERVSAVASKLKSRLGTGGSARGGEILIQGDRRQDVAALLADLGFKVKVKK